MIILGKARGHMFYDRLALCLWETAEHVTSLFILQFTFVCWCPIGLLQWYEKNHFCYPWQQKNPRSETTICQRMPVWHLSALDVGSFYSSVLQLWVSKCTWFHPVWFLLNKPCCLGVCCGGRVYEQMLFAVHLRNSAGTDFLINMFTKAGCRHVVWELWVADRHSCKRKKLLKRILTNIHACLGAGKWISSLINLPY